MPEWGGDATWGVNGGIENEEKLPHAAAGRSEADTFMQSEGR